MSWGASMPPTAGEELGRSARIVRRVRRPGSILLAPGQGDDPGHRSRKNGVAIWTNGRLKSLNFEEPGIPRKIVSVFWLIFLGGQLKFRGNADDYYNADNTLLPRVMTTRLGIPITLTLLYMFIGQRCGIPVEGINFPGHFLARHDGVLFDPFERGRIIGIPSAGRFLPARSSSFNRTILRPPPPSQSRGASLRISFTCIRAMKTSTSPKSYVLASCAWTGMPESELEFSDSL